MHHVMNLQKWKDLDFNFNQPYRKAGNMENAFDCDNCKSKNIGETYQDKTGNIFVCQDCFDKSNDGTHFVPVVKIVDRGECVSDEKLQEEIKLSKAEDVSTLMVVARILEEYPDQDDQRIQEENSTVFWLMKAVNNGLSKTVDEYAEGIGTLYT